MNLIQIIPVGNKCIKWHEFNTCKTTTSKRTVKNNNNNQVFDIKLSSS